MSLYDKASIALIPSGYKATTLYSVMPANGNGDFTHSRSNTTATRVNKDGLIEDVGSNIPRLDYPLTNGLVGDCPHLLLEPQRTNSLTYSTLAFNGGATPTGWSVGFGTGTFSHTETTYKGQGAVKHTQSTTGRSYLSETISLSASTTYTLRVEFDRNNSSGIDDTDYIVATANMSNSFTKQWSDVDDDGILEVQFTTGTDATGELRLGFGVSGNEDGGKTIVFSMPQIEAGSYATSYIPTTSASVTRSADLCYGAGTSAQVNNDAGAFFVEIQALEEGSSASRRISVSAQNSDNRILIETDELDGVFKIFIAGGGTVRSVTTSSGNTQTDMNKIAVGYDGVNAKAYINGIQVGSITDATTRTGMDTVDIADWNGTSNVYYGRVKQVIVFNEALSDSELQTLTS